MNVTVADHLATIRLDRPPMNAVNTRMQVELSEAAAYVGRVPQFRAAVVYGGPNVFAGGADVKEMADKAHLDMQAFTQRLQAAFTAVAEIPKPVVAAITGYALGGGLELALCADFRVCGESAKLGQPEILLGIIPGAGGTQRLPRLIGPARAKNLIFTGRMVDAAEALRIQALRAGPVPPRRCGRRSTPSTLVSKSVSTPASRSSDFISPPFSPPRIKRSACTASSTTARARPGSWAISRARRRPRSTACDLREYDRLTRPRALGA